jgi:hypothetical protein
MARHVVSKQQGLAHPVGGHIVSCQVEHATLPHPKIFRQVAKDVPEIGKSPQGTATLQEPEISGRTIDLAITGRR